MSWRLLASLRSFAANLVVLTVTVALIVAFGEWFLRWSALQPMHADPHLHRPVASGGLVYELRPSHSARGWGRETVTTNGAGFRMGELDPAKPVIAFLGDSMTFGFGVEDGESNPAVVQGRFPDYQVVNAGVNAYNIEQEVLAYEQKVARLDPALVVLEFVINDADPKAHYNAEGILTTENVTQAELDERLRKAITAPGTWRFPGKVFLHEHSAIFTFVERRTKGLWFRAKSGSLIGEEWTEAKRRYYADWFARLNRSVGDRPKLLVLWPDGSLHPGTIDWLHHLAEGSGWKILDLAQVYGLAYRTLGWDHHPTAAEQRRAGEAIAAFISHARLLPSRGSGSVL